MSEQDHNFIPGSPAEKEARLMEILQGQPASLDTLYDLALLYEAEFLDYHKAIQIYHKILEIDPGQIRSWHSLGIIYYLLCNDRKCKEAFLKVIELDPTFSPTSWIYVARLTDDPEEALKYINRGLEIIHDFYEASEVLGDIHFKMGKYDLALKAYQSFLNHHAEDTEVHLKKIRTLIALDRLEEAEAELDRISASMTSRFDYWNVRGELYKKKGEFSIATESFRKALEIQANNPPALHGLTEIELEAGRFEHALESIEHLLAKNSTDKKGLELKGLLLIELNRSAEALEIFDQLLVLDPNNARALSSKSELHSRLSQFELSLLTLDRLLALHPDDSLAWFQRGLVLDQLKRYNESIESYEKAIELNPEFGSAWNNRGYAFYAMKNYEEAVKSYTRTIELKNDFVASWYNRSCSYALLGKIPESISDLDQALRMKERYRSLAMEDSDFESIRNHPDFVNLVTSKPEPAE